MADLAAAREEIRGAQGRARTARQPRGPRPRRARHRRVRRPHHRPAGARRAALDAVQRRHQGSERPRAAEPRRRSARPAVRTDPPGRGGHARGVEPAPEPEPRWPTNWRRRAGSPTICCCPIASSSTSAAARCSTCWMRRTRATMSRRRSRRRGWPSCTRSIACWRPTNRLIEALGVSMPPAAVWQRARALQGQSDPAVGPRREQHAAARMALRRSVDAPRRDPAADAGGRVVNWGRVVSFMHWLDHGRRVRSTLSSTAWPTSRARRTGRRRRSCCVRGWRSPRRASCRSTRSSRRSTRSGCGATRSTAS